MKQEDLIAKLCMIWLCLLWIGLFSFAALHAWPFVLFLPPVLGLLWLWVKSLFEDG